MGLWPSVQSSSQNEIVPTLVNNQLKPDIEFFSKCAILHKT